ncbi:MAG: hypothetical protein JKY54_07355 [Flavobacteriales bacterium]|nr:hypothetical protein [Flavobacteriales bacterium]
MAKESRKDPERVQERPFKQPVFWTNQNIINLMANGAIDPKFQQILANH